MKLQLKSSIIEKALSMLSDQLDELRDEISTKLSAGGDKDESITEGSYSGSGLEDMAREEADRLRREAERIEGIINTFKNYKFEKEHTSIGPLALAKTDKGYFFITRAMKDVVLDDIRVKMIGTDAPIYSELEYKKAGETVRFNQLELKVESII